MKLNITKGIQQKPLKVCLYGVEGIGKTTFASQFPDPLFVDLDKGSAWLDVARVHADNWKDLIEIIKTVYNEKPCKTLVIDTADAAERLCIKHICGEQGKKGIEDFGYGAGYTYLAEEFAFFLTQLETVITSGINVVLLAHATMKRVSKPDDMGEYDHWELKLNTKTTNKVAPLVKEWADLLLFANYKTIVVTTDGNKKKATGGERVMYTTHTPFADAKNRFGLPEELPFRFDEIRHLLENKPKPKAKAKPKAKEKEKTDPESETEINLPLEALKKLMERDGITEAEIRKAVCEQEYFPETTPISDYPVEFIDNNLIENWEGLKNYIVENR